ncbi:MAG: electron transport complex protein RnfE [Lysobacterales bacterium]|jgi:electron transport complex protein RnfE
MNNYFELKTIFMNGLWHQNTGLVVLLGLCPLLAVSGTVINGLGLGLATMLTLMASNLSVSLLRGLLRPEIRIPAFVLIIASVVTALELLMQAWLYDLYRILGIFIPLIVTNCAIIGRAEVFASKNRPLPSLIDGFATGLGFCLTLVLLGALRELTGRGTLFADAHLMFGSIGEKMTITVVPDHPGFLLAILPPGAFIGLGLLIAARNWWHARRSEISLRLPTGQAEVAK